MLLNWCKSVGKQYLLAATAGKPIPGNVEFPQQINPDKGVLEPANKPVSVCVFTTFVKITPRLP
ncbi:MAG: hypothetical protein KME23_25825 [Goleter apudmare HA4340-LM2]|jgi:hypothetical protein|nr:hypothetical protein [Goleter apudmare HA4340-LM2]